MHATRENRRKIILLLAYAGMLLIQIIITVLDNMSFYHYFPSSIPRSLIKCILYGFLIYLIPYKRIQNNIRTRIFNICQRFNLDNTWYVSIQLFLDAAITLLIFTSIIFVQSNGSWRLSYFRISKYLPIILAAFTLIRFLRVLGSNWITYILCCFIWIPVVVILTHEMTKRFVFSGIVGISMLFTYLIGVRRMTHKTNWLRVIICLSVSCVAFWFGMVFTHNTQNLLGIFYPEKYISDSVSNMIYLIWKNPLFTVPEKVSSFFYLEHPLIAINMYLGAPALILFLGFQIIFVIFLFLTWKDAMKKSETGGLLFGCLGLHFVVIYMYSFLSDIGVIPATTIHYMYHSIDIPILFLLLRLTNLDSVYGIEGPIAKFIDAILALLFVTNKDYDLYELKDIDNSANSFDVAMDSNTKNENPLPKPNKYRSKIDELPEISEKSIQDSFHEKEKGGKEGDNSQNGE